MMRPDDVKGLLARIEAERPVLGVDAAEIISAGRRIRRRRKQLAAAGSALATVGAAVLIAFVAGPRPVERAPVEPATTVPTVESPTSCAFVLSGSSGPPTPCKPPPESK